MSDDDVKIEISRSDFVAGLELEDIAYLMQKANPNIVVIIIDHTIIKIMHLNDFPVAYKLLSYSTRNGGIFHIEGIDGNNIIYTIFGIDNMERIFPGFINSYPQCNFNRITIYLDGKYNEIPYSNNILLGAKIKTREIIEN